MIELLTEETLRDAVDALARQDSRLAVIVESYGRPPLWDRVPGFPTLLHIILEQQVSLASARAAFTRLLAAASPLTPERFLEFDDATLKTIGFSRQKTRYGRELAAALLIRKLDLDELGLLDDDTVRERLCQVKGIGRWTADIYLLMALRRPDVWPRGDLALAAAARGALELDHIPSQDELAGIAGAWRPWRAVAARLLWHHYLSSRGPGRTSSRRSRHIT